MTLTGQAPAPTTIVFGTDGWRARIADEFTYDNVRRCADGVAAYVVERGETAKGVVIAYDRRFSSEYFAIAAAEVLLAHDIPVAYAVHAVPTQMSSFEVVERGAAAGIVITASHNPWVDNGFKVKAPTGAAAGAEILGVIEARLARNGGVGIDRRPFADAEAAGLVERFDPYDGYERFVRTHASTSMRSRRPTCRSWSTRCGAPGAAGCRGCWPAAGSGSTRSTRSAIPYFGGVNPEPIRPNIDEALGLLAGGGYDLGLFLDGDADRAGAADERGTFIHQLEVTGLLMYYLAEHRGLREPVVVSVNNTSMAARLGEHYGITTHETPVGFKFIGPKMIETGAMMGAEESGGFGFGMHLPERDGVYADLMLLDLFLRERAAGRWPVSRAIAHFHELAGPSFYLRVDVHVERAAYPRPEAPPAGRPRRGATGRAGGPAGRPDHAARHRRRLQVLPRRRVVAARPGVGDRAARPRLHRGDVGRAAGRAARRRRTPGPRLVTDDVGRRPRGGSTSRGATS